MSNRKWVFLIIAVAAIASVPSPTIGQGEPDLCQACYCTADALCAGMACDFSSGECGGIEFTAPCGGNWSLKIQLSCPSPAQCKYCTPCVQLWDYTIDQLIIQQHLDCTENNCEGIFANIAMTYHHDYVLKVCLQACEEGGCDPAETGCDNCVARAWIYSDWSVCSNCNP